MLWIGKRGSRGWLLLSVCMIVHCAHTVHATPNNAHIHYQIGVRANAGARHAAILYQESSAPGLDLAMAAEDARAMIRLASEIETFAARLDSVATHDEAAAISGELASMRDLAACARTRAAELARWIDEEPTATPAAGPPLRIAGRCRELFSTFGGILRSHKQAELKLGIAPPPDPPAPAPDE